jgi:hypothetical protein
LTAYWELGDQYKACRCLEYQSCEHLGWETSEARAIVRNTMSTAICKLPGYEEADWEINESSPTHKEN